jgi:hypothetical protein
VEWHGESRLERAQEGTGAALRAMEPQTCPRLSLPCSEPLQAFLPASRIRTDRTSVDLSRSAPCTPSGAIELPMPSGAEIDRRTRLASLDLCAEVSAEDLQLERAQVLLRLDRHGQRCSASLLGELIELDGSWYCQKAMCAALARQRGTRSRKRGRVWRGG